MTNTSDTNGCACYQAGCTEYPTMAQQREARRHTQGAWFLCRTDSNGRPDLTTYIGRTSSERHFEGVDMLRDALECGARAARDLWGM